MFPLSWFRRRIKLSRSRRPARPRLERLESRETPADFGFAFGVGGTLIDEGRAVASDAAGNVYVAGAFRGTADFDPGPGVFNLTSASATNSDAFVAKYNAAGGLVWARRFGDALTDVGNGLAVDAAGNVYTTGSFVGTVDFDPGPGTFTLATGSTSSDVFVSKLNSAGEFVWARHFHTNGDDSGNALSVDAGGNVYTTGQFSGSADFDPGPGVFTLSGSLDVFVWKLNSFGDFVWARQFAGGNQDAGNALAVDAAGNVYTTGQFQGTVDFNPGAGQFNLSSAGFLDVFVSKLDSGGNFVWAGRLGGDQNNDIGYGLAVDPAGNVYTTGYFRNTADFDPGPGVFNLTDTFDQVFVSKLDGGGNFVWARQMGLTGGHDRAFALALDGCGHVYTTGVYANGADFDPGPGTRILTGTGSFVCKLDGDGNFVEALRINGGTTEGHGLAVGSGSNVAVTGWFNGADGFPDIPGSPTITSNGNRDAFVARLDFNCAPTDLTLSPSSVFENRAIGTAVGTLTTTDPDTDDTHSYALVPGPGADGNASFTIDGNTLRTTAVFDFETQASYSIRVRTTDLGGLSFEKVFTVTITDIPNETENQPPVLAPIGNRSLDEQTQLAFTATAADAADQTLTYSLQGNVPAGASIHPTTGVFTWTPTEAQGPASFAVTVRVTDNGNPVLFDEETITVTVNEVNQAPVLAAIGNRTSTIGVPVTFTAAATDPDAPANALTFSLGIGVPAGASINAATGAFTFAAATPGTYVVRVVVTDDGSPNLTDFEDVTIVVNPAPVGIPTVESVVINDGQAQRSQVTSVTVRFSTAVNLGANAFELVGPGGSPALPTPTVTLVDGKTVVRFSFPAFGPGSLADGTYSLRVHGDLITDAGGQRVDGDRNGTQGGDAVETFFRRYGDLDGDGKVTLLVFVRLSGKPRIELSGDYGAMLDALRGGAYVSFLDYNGDGVINSRDQVQGRYRLDNVRVIFG